MSVRARVRQFDRQRRRRSVRAPDGTSLYMDDAVLGRMSGDHGTNRAMLDVLLKEALCYQPGSGQEAFRYFLTIYELYRKVLTVPGHIVEVGVWRGYTTALLGYLVQLHGEVGRQRRIYGFDTFAGYGAGDVAQEADTTNPVLTKSYENTSRAYVASMLADLGLASIVELVEGDVAESVPRFLDEHRDFKIALLLNDVNLYAPSKVALEALLPRMQPGGVIYLDSYNNPRQLGETRATDEVMATFGLTLQRDPPPFSPPAYCVVPTTGL